MDPDLLQRLRGRDMSALADLVRLHGPAIARAAYLFLHDGHAAEDMAQETMVAAWDAAPRTTVKTSLQPWLFGILLNRCRKYQRSSWRRLRRERRAGSAGRPDAAADEQEQDRLTRLRRALAGLDEDLRAVVILRYEQGLTVAETGRALGVPEGTVKSRAHTALQRLRQVMRCDGG